MNSKTCGEVLGIVVARAGSKGVPRKNIRLLGDKPLISYTFEAAMGSQQLTRVILSTDSQEIADVGRLAGVDVPFMRPSELALDNTPTLSVINHALEYLQAGEGYCPDIVVLLQPTAPFRQAKHIEEAVELLRTSSADAIVSVTPIPQHYSPHWQFEIKGGKLEVFTGESLANMVTRRQELPTTYTRNGAIYAFWYRTLKESGSIYGSSCIPYVMPEEFSVNIDSLDDWNLAERYLKAKPNI